MTASDQLGRTFKGTVVGCFKASLQDIKKTTENLRGTAGLRVKNRNRDLPNRKGDATYTTVEYGRLYRLQMVS
jgi:hypothetical protein